MKLHLGDCLEVLKEYPDNHFDSIVCDPPAGISFMGLAFDSDRGGRDHWIAWMQTIAAECLRTLKPGAHALVWSLPRTSHWTATAWENAGWEVRDRVSHIFGSGFPKSHNISIAIDKLSGAEREVIGKMKNPASAKVGTFNCSFDDSKAVITAPATDAAKQFSGFGTALKPAMEDWWLLRKPISESSIAANVLKWGCGGLNIDACRVESGERPLVTGDRKPDGSKAYRAGLGGSKCEGTTTQGRWPAHLVHDGSDCVMAEFAKYGETPPRNKEGANKHGESGVFDGNIYSIGKGVKIETRRNVLDSGTPARFFYCAKPSQAERNQDGENNHPTVKSLALMKWLITLITPPGGVVLDCFAGSGSTIRAALELGFDCVGIEQDEEHFATMKRRADGATLPLFAEAA
jgi:DNA modification methylase